MCVRFGPAHACVRANERSCDRARASSASDMVCTHTRAGSWTDRSWTWRCTCCRMGEDNGSDESASCVCVRFGPHMRACVQMSVHVIERARALPLTWCALTPGRAAGRIGAGHGAARVAGWARTMGVMRTLRPRVRRRRRMPGACSTRTTAPRTWASRSRRGDGEHAL